MAAAEARALWQRTVNRYFVQEDAKRAPKLAYCQSSTSSSKQVDGPPTNAAESPEHHPTGFMPLNRTPSYSSLPPDTRWWLQLQPGYGYQRGITIEQLNALEAEVENLIARDVPSEATRLHSEAVIDSTSVDCNKTNEFDRDAHCQFADADGRKNIRQVETRDEMASHPKNANDFTETKKNNGFTKAEKSDEYCFDPNFPWIGAERNVPWWRTTDKDDLASLVAQKSLDYIENCDLPPPQMKHVGVCSSGRLGSLNDDEKQASSAGWQGRTGFGSSIASAQNHPQSDTLSGTRSIPVEGHSQSSSDRSFRNSYATTPSKDATDVGEASENDTCKAQLLEALRHSQTRAREAEKVAKQACAEKEDIIKLFFKQASQLFAYKQWFQMLQLETLYYQMKNIDQPMSVILPAALPWMHQKGKKTRKSWQKSPKGKRGKRGRPRRDIGKYAVAIALGFSLVGAGLLLGWTVGWMLPF